MSNFLETARLKSLNKDELTDDQWSKLKCHLEPGRWIAIFWKDLGRKQHDTGYLLVTPECEIDEADCFVHIVKPLQLDSKDTNFPEWIHLHDLMRNELVTSIED